MYKHVTRVVEGVLSDQGEALAGSAAEHDRYVLVAYTSLMTHFQFEIVEATLD